MKGGLITLLVAGLAMTTAGGMWGAAGWILFLAAMVGLWVQRTIINKLREEVKYTRNELELISDQSAKLKRDLDDLDQRFLIAHTKMLEMSKNMKRILEEEKDRDMEVALLKRTVETNAATIERLSNALDQREMGNDTA